MSGTCFPQDHSLQSALLYGHFLTHCKQASEGSLGERIVHVIVAALEVLPIFGQIVALAEWLIFHCACPGENPGDDVDAHRKENQKVEATALNPPPIFTDLTQTSTPVEAPSPRVHPLGAATLTLPVEQEAPKKVEAEVEEVIDAIENPLPADILQTAEFQAIFSAYSGDGLECVIEAALWLVAMASCHEKPAVLAVMGKIPAFFHSVDGPIQNARQRLLAQVAIWFVEEVNQLKFESDVVQTTQVAKLAFARINNLYFHGTHINSLESIRQHGLSIEHLGSDARIDKLHKLASEVLNQSMLFGYRYLNCQGVDEQGKVKKRVYVSGFPATSASYAVGAPEWASEFFGSRNYAARNKQQALAYLEMRLETWQTQVDNRKRALTAIEAQEFRDCFERTWEHYKEFKPVVFKVLAPSGSKRNFDASLEWALEWNEESDKRWGRAGPSDAVQRVKKAFQFLVDIHFMRNDYGLEKSVPPSHVTPFFLPVKTCL